MPALRLPTNTLVYQDWLDDQQRTLARRERLQHALRKAHRLCDLDD